MNITQRQYVEGCLQFYEDALLTPEPGWHRCHYPIPKRLGGSDWVWLLPEHHAFLGVLQSEEFQTPCLGQWEHHHLTGDFYSLARHWQKVQREEALGPDGRLKGTQNRDRESFVQAGKAAYPRWKDKVTFESCSKGGKAGAKTQHAQRWKCLVTGYITTPGPLSRYQKTRGIDTSLRVQVG